MRLSIAIVNWNTSELLAGCLQSIRRQRLSDRTKQVSEEESHEPRSDLEVIVVDNASADFDLASFSERFPEVRFIRNSENIGYAAANNQAIREAKGEYILLLNPDVELKEGALDRLVAFMDTHPDAAAAGCRLLRPDGMVEQSCRGFPTPKALAAEYLGLSKLFPNRFGSYRMRWFTYDSEAEVDQPMASCLILSRRAIEDVGLFDTRFPIFFNDVDWCLRAKKKGWKIYFTPSAEAVHIGGASTRQIARRMQIESQRSLLEFYRKHYGMRPAYFLIMLGVYLNRYLIRKQGEMLRNGHAESAVGNKEGNCDISSNGSEGYDSSTREGRQSDLLRQGKEKDRNPDESNEQIRVTVSIVNWNTREELERCLESVFRQDGSVEFEVIVVDNASSDGSREMVRRRFPQVKLIENSANLGFSRAQNKALRQARGRYILMLNPDSELPEADALARISAYLDENPDVAILGLRVLNPDGSLQFSARRFPTIGAALFRHTLLGRLFPKNRFVREYVMADWDHREVRDVDWVSGCAMMLRREALERIGLLDERFYMYVEDVDICYRAQQGGLKVRYFPFTTCIHRIGAASDKAPYRMIYHFHRSMFRFYLKHYARGPGALLLPLVLAGLIVRGIGFALRVRR